MLAVPYDGHDELVGLAALAGKTVISCVNPLAFDKRGAHGRVVDGGEGSAAESAQRLAPEATVVGAFHNVSAVLLWGEEDFLDEDVLVVGDVVEAKQVAMELAASVTGRAGIDAGKLRLARQLEPLHRGADLDQPQVQGALRHPDHRSGPLHRRLTCQCPSGVVPA